jgi:hypothetical protein
MKRAMTAAVLILGLGSVADAQIIRQRTVTRPSMYTSLSIGWLQQEAICDPDSNACWNFSDAAQYRVAFEKPVGPATSFGVSYAHAAVPLLWADTAACQPCDANSEMHQLLALFHLGGDGPFSQLIDLSAGATRFANFKTTNGTPLGTGKPATDFSFSVSYGFGARISTGLYFTLQQEYAVTFHKRFSGTQSGAAEQRIIRAGLRLAL